MLDITADKKLTELGYTPKLHRSLTTWQLVSFGLIYLQPIGAAVIFGFLLTTSKGTVALPYLFAFIGMIFTILSYSLLIKEYPLAGSVYNYVRMIAGPFFGFIAGWLLALDYILIPTITSVSAAIYAHQLIHSISYEAWLFAFVLSMGLFNLIGIRSTTLIGSILLAIQIVVVLAGFVIWSTYISDNGSNIGNLFSTKPFQFDSFKGIIEASSLAIFSFLGFDAVTTLAEESVNPRKDIPKAMMLCTCIGFAIMFLTGYLGVLVVSGWKELSSDQNWVNATLFHVAKLTGGDTFAIIYTVGFILAMVVTNLVGTAAATRLLYGMGRDGVIPRKIFNTVNQKWKTPHGSIFFIICLELLLGSFANQDQLAELINYGAITAFIILNVGVLYLGYKIFRKKIQLKISNEISSTNFYIRFVIFPFIAFMIMTAIFVNIKQATMLCGMIWTLIGIGYYWVFKGKIAVNKS